VLGRWAEGPQEMGSVDRQTSPKGDQRDQTETRDQIDQRVVVDKSRPERFERGLLVLAA
jgi:hypothetical protein